MRRHKLPVSEWEWIYHCWFLDEIDKFLERYKLPKLTQEETDNSNTPISIEEIEFIVENLPTKKIQGYEDFTEGILSNT